MPFAKCGDLSGHVFDGATGEPLVGATVEVLATAKYAIVGLDGSFSIKNVPNGVHILEVSFLGFERSQKEITVNGNTTVEIVLREDSADLEEFVVQGSMIKGSEMQARNLERNAPNTLNVISKKAIELSPDITVANIVQRVSGLSVERNANGDPQHAIVRGMDKRYNYTLINGVKIPSPDNKNRYIPLDIFPAQLLERLEVSKSLTAGMEGDAIGGAVNLVMKDAPEEFMIEGDLQLGYNQINFDRGYYQYDRSEINRQSPYEQFGSQYFAEVSDFPTSNMSFENQKQESGSNWQLFTMPDLLGSLTLGNRYFGNKLGVMLGGSFQNSYRGVDSNWFRTGMDNFGSGRPTLQRLQERKSSTQQQRYAIHSKLDYYFNENHKIDLYLGNYQLNDFRVRDMVDTETEGRNFSMEEGNGILTHITRYTTRYQNIRTANLSGEHKFNSNFRVHWSGVGSIAGSESPDDGIFKRNGELANFVEQPQNIERRNYRRWENNTDTDLTGYLNFYYTPSEIAHLNEISVGGMYRKRERDSFFNRYIFDPANPAFQIQGIHWESYADVNWGLLNPRGGVSDPLNFESYENISAAYLNTNWSNWGAEVNLGVRLEHTVQGYELKVAQQSVNADSSQNYVDVLPSIGIKYKLAEKTNLRASYYKALARPGFHEIVPYRLSEDDGFDESGNPSLNRVRSHNYDLRWEYFPSLTEQVLVGAFVKDIRDPIEYTLVRDRVTSGPLSLRPNNFGNAFNWGLEADFIKFFNKIGIRMNYTYTNSTITTPKINQRRENPDDESSQLVQVPVDQSRPLQGQADHIGNLSLMYKNQLSGTDMQIAMVYTGERIEFVSPFLENDHWSKPITQLDFSFDQKIGKYLTVFARINNILDSPYELFIKSPLAREEARFPYQSNPEETTVRIDRYGQSYRLGIRFKVN
ncbi:TonB-dependent receptor [Pleomorphovibrio marinus]|uniref:TonB-dependent receptor n=1 Tax=Pleomorphovibrio marinus TaxID=2164132 RepID=UPI0018E56FE0|nr:TonB-dependent receptor [Pleomorphovibrio marinus]